MKVWLYLMVGMLPAIGAAARAGEGAALVKPVAKEQPAGADKPFELNSELTGKFAEIARGAKLPENHQRALVAIQAEMQKVIERLDKANKKRIENLEANIKKSSNQKTRASLQRQLERLKAGRETLAASYQLKAMNSLTPEQKGEYNGPKLWAVVQKNFGAIKLEVAQTEKALNICKTLCRMTISDLTKSKTLLNSATTRIVSQVLTREQKQAYLKSKRPQRTPPQKTPRRKTTTGRRIR